MTHPLSLTLLRHAKSDWNDPSLSDFDRPLNARGQRDLPAMAARFGPAPSRIISSPALRAITTARGMVGALGLSTRDIHTIDRLYAASPDTIWAAITDTAAAMTRATDTQDTPHLLVVGHNPGMSELARALVAEDIAELPTCSWLRCELNTVTTGIPTGQARFIAFETPRDAR